MKARSGRKVFQPLVLCSRHHVLKSYNTYGEQICKLCNKDRAKERAEKRRSSGLPPTPCSKCGSERIWDTFGAPKCQKCRYEYEQQWKGDRPGYMKEYLAGYYHDNKEEYAVKGKIYRNINKDAIKETRDIYMKRFDREYWIWKSFNARCHNPTNKQYPDYGKRGVKVCEEWRRDPNASVEENLVKYRCFKEHLDTVVKARPTPDYSLDRKNNDKGYEPGNLRWATRQEQNINRRVSLEHKASIQDNSLIYYPDGHLMILSDFAEEVDLPLAVARYRYAQHWEADWILQADCDSRFYEYGGHNYNMTELSIMSGISFPTLYGRINTSGWSVEKAMETPVQYRRDKR